jgi:hypothetical protein
MLKCAPYREVNQDFARFSLILASIMGPLSL